MTSYNVIITKQARVHLQVIRKYVTFVFKEPESARNLIKLLKQEISSLSYMPERIRLVDEEPWRSLGFRKKTVGNYFIYFWINTDKQQVKVFAVINVKMDQTQQLKNISFG